MKQQNNSEQQLLELQRITFDYFIQYANAEKGLIADNSREDAPCSITAVGLALASYPIAVERGYLSRDNAVTRTLATLRFFWNSAQGTEPNATGYKGFYYHFLGMESGRRHDQSELSTIDTTFLIAGALTAGQYFDREIDEEREIRELADALYRRVDWQWALDEGRLVSMGWWPESGFHETRWYGYTEALLLYVLGLASPTHPLPADSYDAWLETYEWQTHYGIECLYAPPLFIHQLSHLWIDFRDIQDAYMREKSLDYFENSRRANSNMRLKIQRTTKGMVSGPGALPPVMARATWSKLSTESRDSFGGTWREARREDPTTAHSHPGASWPVYLLRLKSSCRRLTISTRIIRS